MQIVVFALAMILSAVSTWGQVTSNVFSRVLQIRSPSMACSAFTIEVERKQFLVTARHCLGGVTESNPLLVRQGAEWKPIKGPFYFPSNSDVDIAATQLAQQLTPDYAFEATSDGIALGQQVFFLGYPYDLSTKWKPTESPNLAEIAFIKAGILSAMDSRNAQAVILYIDGHNNPGFSGGPIVFRPNSNAPFRVAAVVKGFRGEVMPVIKQKDALDLKTPAFEDLYARANTGIVVGYSIEHIVKAITDANK